MLISAADPDPITSPFPRLAALLDGLEPGRPPINLTVGEPRHGVPDFVAPVLARETAGFGRYPAIRGTEDFRHAVAGWLDRRYGLGGSIDPQDGILPLNGTREGLFYAIVAAARHADRSGARPVALLPNPFYQTYAIGAQVAGCELVMTGCGPEDGFLPRVDTVSEAVLARTIVAVVASPANPQGAVLDCQAWRAWIEAARRHDFLLIADECYSEIYRRTPPVGVLEAAHRHGLGYANILAVNSLSKRSNLPGLRCGFAAGDPGYLSDWAIFRNMAAPQVPEPVQAVAVAAFGDEDHVIANRDLYNQKYALADAILGDKFGYARPDGGFFLWLDVGAFGGGVAVAETLWRQAGLRVIPGAYLARAEADGNNPADPYIRLAMVEPPDITEQALARLAETLT